MHTRSQHRGRDRNVQFTSLHRRACSARVLARAHVRVRARARALARAARRGARRLIRRRRVRSRDGRVGHGEGVGRRVAPSDVADEPAVRARARVVANPPARGRAPRGRRSRRGRRGRADATLSTHNSLRDSLVRGSLV